ncbi:hypothetical protein SADUNF_Sadunf18G0043000 [Salix dunnii]|uniref:Uncharacterized protein n=1 Tax=Salix dunnii TaxID=1413687 RepID=A0A835J490_9ROSI|nr:hypothetical protein SADUNF_Sadunf18G0043000 [Salix dunnii]
MDVKCIIPGESITGDESKGKERSEKKLGSGKKKDKYANSKSSREHSEHELGDGHKNLKLSRGTKKSIGGKRSQKNLESSTSSDEGSLESKEVNDGKDPNPVGACLDMITKRKQQREAVKAILNSSSKKSEPSTKPMSSKRPPPTSVYGMKSDSVSEILAEPILSSLKVYGKKAGLILNIKHNLSESSSLREPAIDANQGAIKKGKEDVEDVGINFNTDKGVVQEGKEDVEEETNMEEILPSM